MSAATGEEVQEWLQSLCQAVADGLEVRVGQRKGHVTLVAIAGATFMVPCFVVKSLQLISMG